MIQHMREDPSRTEAQNALVSCNKPVRVKLKDPRDPAAWTRPCCFARLAFAPDAIVLADAPPAHSLHLLLCRLCWQTPAPPQSLHWLLLRACWQMLAPSRAPRAPSAWTRPCLLSVGGRPSAAPRGLVRGSSSSEPCIKSVGAGAAGCAGSSSGESRQYCQLQKGLEGGKEELSFLPSFSFLHGFVRESVKEVLPCLPATLCSRIIVSSTFAPFCLHCRSRITEVPSHAPFEFAKRCCSSTQRMGA